jgi:hypothetical protein
VNCAAHTHAASRRTDRKRAQPSTARTRCGRRMKKPGAAAGERRPGSVPDSSLPGFSRCWCCRSLPIAARKSLSIQPGSGKEDADFALLG